MQISVHLEVAIQKRTMLQPSIYQELLGPAYGQLGPFLQQVHGQEQQVRARGVVTVVHGKGILVRFSNWMANVPPAKENTHLKLEIQRSGNRETWIRNFEGKMLATDQWAEDGLFIETSGPFKLGMRLRFEEGILRFESVYTKFLGVKVPRKMGVNVLAQVREHAQGWDVSVETRTAMMGLLFSYKGTMELEP
jgi:hypothetical protein